MRRTLSLHALFLRLLLLNLCSNAPRAMANPVSPTHPIPEGTFHNVTVHHVNRDERGNAHG